MKKNFRLNQHSIVNFIFIYANRDLQLNRMHYSFGKWRYKSLILMRLCKNVCGLCKKNLSTFTIYWFLMNF